MAERTAPSPLTPPVRLHAPFERVRRYGPTLTERVDGSPLLRRRQPLGRRLCRATGQVRITGLEWIPRTGPVIVAANHQSVMDGLLLIGYLERMVSCMIKAEAFAPASGRLGRFLIGGAQIPVLRGEIDPAPVRLALDILDAGGVLGIFPEGTRGDGSVRRARPGVGYFALRTGATVVPIAIHGSAALMKRRGAARPPLSMTVGEPLRLQRAATTRPLARAEWLSTTEQIRVALAELVTRTEPSAKTRATPAPSVAKAQ